MTEPAISYLRVSGEAQVEGDGFPRQGACTQKYGDANGYSVEAMFLERGVCGANELGDRPSMLEAIAYMQHRGIRYMLVEDFRRFARDLIVQELLLRDFSKAGIHVIDCTANADMTIQESTDPTAVLIRQILGALAQWERLTIVMRLKLAKMRKRQQNGHCEGPRAFGQDKQRASERVALARMLDLSAEGFTQRKIAQMLNSEGYLTRQGRKWTNLHVSRALQHHKKALDWSTRMHGLRDASVAAPADNAA